LGEEETDYAEFLEAELNKARSALVTLIVATQFLHVELCFWKYNQLS
jgi:hypothetical protein